MGTHRLLDRIHHLEGNVRNGSDNKASFLVPIVAWTTHNRCRIVILNPFWFLVSRTGMFVAFGRSGQQR